MNAFLYEVTLCFLDGFTVHLFEKRYLASATVDNVVRVRKDRGLEPPIYAEQTIRAEEINTHGQEACFVNALKQSRWELKKRLEREPG